MLKSVLTSFILVVSFVSLVLSQQARPLPSPIISIQCGQLSILRHTRLVSPTNQQVPITCTYRIQALSFSVCQMRLEFRTFSLNGPVLDSTGPSAFMRCNGGNMQVGNITLCGENSGQHIYIPVNPRNVNERQLTITFNTRNGNGNGNGNGMSPVWDIAVHQLECPLGMARSIDTIEPIATADKVEIFRQPRTFFREWIAPAGCLQYFIEPNGQFDSFNFNNGVGPYIGDMDYAICFRRLRGDQSIRFIPTFFRMNSGNPQSPGFDEDCLTSVDTPNRSEDYLFIPNAETNGVTPTRTRLFCGQSLNSQIVTSTPPGPFIVTFHSDREYSPTEEIGFRMRYEIV